MASDRFDDDPQGANWGGYAWSAWCPLDEAIAPRQRKCSNQPGIYRLRCHGQKGFLYVGETGGKLVSRLRQLRKATQNVAMGKEPGPPHVAGVCVWAYEKKGHLVEVSWIEKPGLDDRERKGIECDLIAAHRRAMGASPSCQFGGGRSVEHEE